MRAILISLVLGVAFATRLAAQAAAPVEVTRAAVEAVRELGQQVVLGKHQIAIDRMYPEWKERAAKRAGGMEKLEEQLAGVATMMAQQGVQLISFKPAGVPQSFEVVPGKEVTEEGGRKVETLVYKKWLVLIPTETEYRIARPARDGAPPEFVVIRSTGFQVAVTDKDKSDWTFIDGAGVSVADLRRLFITLPETMQLPPVSRKAVGAK